MLDQVLIASNAVTTDAKGTTAATIDGVVVVVVVLIHDGSSINSYLSATTTDEISTMAATIESCQ